MRLGQAVSGFVSDLRSDDWEPLSPRGPERAQPWRNPCFLSSFLTALSVAASLGRDHGKTQTR